MRQAGGAFEKNTGVEPTDLVGRAGRAHQAEKIVSAISRRLSLEFGSMRELLDGCAGSGTIDEISAEMYSQLTTLRGLIEEGQIHPECSLRLSQEEPQLPPCDRPLRIGVFPTAADPFHWLHLLSGLKVMALHKLDKIIYVITGSDSRKPDLLRADIRHSMGRDILQLFSPLFAYSPIALDNALDGETNVFRILQLNPKQRVDAFYIAGTDHYHRSHPATGKPDTIQKLESGVQEKIFGYDERMSSISAIFLGRGERATNDIDTFLNIESVQWMALEASSTAIRKALAGYGPLEKLATLPYSLFRHIRRLALYSLVTPGISSTGSEDPGVEGRQALRCPPPAGLLDAGVSLPPPLVLA